MMLLNRFVPLEQVYPDAIEQHRARDIMILAVFALVVSVLGAVLMVLQWANAPEDLRILLPVMLVVLAATALITLLLLRVQHLMVAFMAFLLPALVLSIAATFQSGLSSAGILVLAVPVLIAALSGNRRLVGVVIGLLLLWMAYLLIAEPVLHLDQNEAPDLFFNRWRGLIALGFVGLLVALLTGQIRAAQQSYQVANQVADALRTLSQTTAQQSSLIPLFILFADDLRQTLDLQQVQIFMPDERQADRLRLVSGTGLARQLAGTLQGRVIHTKDISSPIVEAYTTGQPILVTSHNLATRRSEFIAGTNAELAVPIRFGDQTLGVLEVQSLQIAPFDTPETTAFYLDLAGQLAYVILNAQRAARITTLEAEQVRLQDQLRSRQETILRLNREIAGAVWRRYFQERGVDVIGYDYDAATNDLQEADRPTTKMQESIHDGQIDIQPREEGGFLLSVPILTRGQVLGAMEFTISNRNSIPTRLVDLATSIAERLSLALENARLFEQVQALAQREQEVSQVATRLQQAPDLEQLLAMAADEFRAALNSEHTHVRLQLEAVESQPGEPASVPAGSSANGGDAA